MEIIPSTYPNYLGMRYKVGLKCDLCCEETTPCARHQKESCTDNDCVCILSLRYLLKKFPTCKRNQLNCKRSISELGKSPWVQAEGKKKFFTVHHFLVCYLMMVYSCHRIECSGLYLYDDILKLCSFPSWFHLCAMDTLIHQAVKK